MKAQVCLNIELHTEWRKLLTPKGLSAESKMSGKISFAYFSLSAWGALIDKEKKNYIKLCELTP